MENLLEAFKGEIRVSPARLNQLWNAFRFHKQLPVTRKEFNEELQKIMERFHFSSMHREAEYLKLLTDLLLLQNGNWNCSLETSIGIFVFLCQFKRKIEPFTIKFSNVFRLHEKKSKENPNIHVEFTQSLQFSSDSEEECEIPKNLSTSTTNRHQRELASFKFSFLPKSKTQIGKVVDAVFRAISTSKPLIESSIVPLPLRKATNAIIRHSLGDNEKIAQILHILLRNSHYSLIELLDLLQEQILPELATLNWQKITLFPTIRQRLQYEEAMKIAFCKLKPFLEQAKKYSIEFPISFTIQKPDDIPRQTECMIQQIQKLIKPFILQEQLAFHSILHFYFVGFDWLERVFIRSCSIDSRENWQFLNFFHLELATYIQNLRIFRTQTPPFQSATEKALAESFWFWNFDFLLPKVEELEAFDSASIHLLLRSQKIFATLVCLQHEFQSLFCLQQHELQNHNDNLLVLSPTLFRTLSWIIFELNLHLRHLLTWNQVSQKVNALFEPICELLLCIHRSLKAKKNDYEKESLIDRNFSLANQSLIDKWNLLAALLHPQPETKS